jgi:hypothetical protein
MSTQQNEATAFEPPAFEKEPEALPDKNGAPVRVGSFIRDAEGVVWRVTKLRPTEAHEPNDLRKTTGRVSMDFSQFEVERFEPTGFQRQFINDLIFTGRVTTGVSLRRAEKVEEGASFKSAFEIQAIETQLDLLDAAQSRIDYLRRGAERRLADLKERRGW